MTGQTSSPDGYLPADFENWDERAEPHAMRSGLGYGVQRSIDDPLIFGLSDAVVFDRDRLGNLAGLRAVHLQRHIGADTISLDRFGARVMGVDFSRRDPGG